MNNESPGHKMESSSSVINTSHDYDHDVSDMELPGSTSYYAVISNNYYERI